MARRTPNLTLILGLAATAGPYTIDAFFPSLRAIGQYFGVSSWQAQQLVTAYIVPYAIMSLVHGSISDAVGRRPVILAGVGLYALASVGCVFAPSFATLMVCRVLQGMVAGVGNVVGRAVIRDCYHGVEAQRAMSAITMIFGLGPVIAPIVGGWAHVLYGWRAVFGTMALYGVLLVAWLWLRLPETHPPDRRQPLHLGSMIRATGGVLLDRHFLALTASSGLCFIGMHAYIGSAPAIILDHWKLGETSFIMLTLPIIGGFTIGAWLSGRLAGRMPPEHQVRLGYQFLLATATAMLLLQWAMAHPPIIVQQGLLFFMSGGLQLMFPVVTLRILDRFERSRGAAASAHSFFSLMLSALMMGVFAPWLSHSMLRIATAVFLTTSAGALLWWVTQRGGEGAGLSRAERTC